MKRWIGFALAAVAVVAWFAAPAGLRRLARWSRRLRGREGVREARRARHLLRVPLRRPFRPGLRVRHAVVPPHHHDPGVHAGAGGGLRRRRGHRRRCWGVSRGATRIIPACPRPTATTTGAGCSSTTCRTRASRASTSRTSRPSRSSGRFRTCRRRTPARSRRPTPSTCSRRRASRCRCPTRASARSRTTRRTSTASSRASRWIPKSGHMSLGFEILMPPFDWDLADAGKGPSHGWEFFTCYNSEEAYDSLEVKASQNEMDYIAARGLARGAEGGGRRQGQDDRRRSGARSGSRSRASSTCSRCRRARTAST